MNIEQVNVAITLDDGTLSMMGFLTVGRGSVLPYGAEWIADGWWKREPNDANLFQEVSRTFTSSPRATNYRLVLAGEVPEDRQFRNALADDGQRLYFDMAKARELRLDQLKRDRVVALEQLDRDWMKAQAAGNPEAVEAKRQAWRDMPETVSGALNAAKDTEELKAIVFPSN